MREDLGSDEALEDSKGSETKVGAEDGEETVEEGKWPAAFRD